MTVNLSVFFSSMMSASASCCVTGCIHIYNYVFLMFDLFMSIKCFSLNLPYLEIYFLLCEYSHSNFFKISFCIVYLLLFSVNPCFYLKIVSCRQQIVLALFSFTQFHSFALYQEYLCSPLTFYCKSCYGWIQMCCFASCFLCFCYCLDFLPTFQVYQIFYSSSSQSLIQGLLGHPMTLKMSKLSYE